MADNVKLSAGTNDGATLRTFEESGGVEWPASVVAYTVTASPGANVLQAVSVGNGLPVKQDGSWTVIPSDTANTTPWVFSIKQGGNTAIVTSGGALTVTGDLTVDTIDAITNPVTVAQGTAANLLCTASQGGSWTVAATQSGSWNVGTVTSVGTIVNPVSVTQGGSFTVGVSGSVTVAQGTASNLKAEVAIAAGQTLGTVTTVGSVTNPVTVAQSTAGNLLCTASQGGTWNVGVTGTAAVTQSGTWNVGVTGTAAVTQSGTWTVGLSAAQTLANVTTVGTITNPVAATQSGTWNVGTLATVTNPVTVAQGTAANLKAEVTIASAQTLATVTTVGTVTNVTTVGTITNPVGLAAGTNLVGRVAGSDETGTIYSGTTALTPKFAKIVASASGNTSVVALVSGKKIRVLRASFVANGSVNVKFQSNTTDVTGLWYMTQFASGGGGYCPVGLFETASGEALNINLSASVAVQGIITYVEV